MTFTRLVHTAVLLMAATHITSLRAAEKYAIVIGVNDCRDFRMPDGAKPRPLKGAEYDAGRFAECLMAKFHFPREHMIVLTHEKATHAAIKQAFTKLTSDLQPADQFVFYFSGHGTQLPDERPLDEDDELDEALCAFDSLSNGDRMVRDDQLGLWLDDLPCRSVTVVLDCCHAGTGTKVLENDEELMSRYLPTARPSSSQTATSEPWRELQGNAKSLRHFTAMFACKAGQQAYERRLAEVATPGRVGQFSYYLIEGLNNRRADTNGDGIVSNRESIAYASTQLDAVFNRARENIKDCEHPVLETTVGDLPIFGEP